MALEELTDGSLGHPLADQAHAGAEDVPDAKERNYVIVPEVLPCDGLTPKGLPHPLGSGPFDQVNHLYLLDNIHVVHVDAQ
jgi:hypothetical protein